MKLSVNEANLTGCNSAMNSATSFMNLPSSQKSVRAFRENECAKHRIYFSQEKGSLENRLVYDKHAPPKISWSTPGLG